MNRELQSVATYNKRAADIDMLRAIGIISMLLGHVGFGKNFETYISAFHMPLFFILSGFLFSNKRSFLGAVKHNFVKLLIPYIFWGGVYEILWTIRGNSQWDGLIWPNTIEVPMNGALWFLPCLFWVVIIASAIFNVLPENVAIISLLVISVMGGFHLVSLPLSMDSSIVACGFFGLGYITKKYLIKLLELKPIILVILLVTTTVSVFYNGPVNIRTNEYSNLALYFINAYFVTIIFWNICRCVYGHIKEFSITRIFIEIGTDSLIYVCCNQFILRILWTVSIGKSFYYSYWWHFIEFLIIITTCFFANRLIKRMHLGMLVGK